MTTTASLFVPYLTPSLPHGVYGISQPPPATITPVGTGVAVEVGQFPWGPPQALTYPGSMNEFWQTFTPLGMDRTNTAHLCTIRKGWPTLGAVRVTSVSSAPVAASCTISNSSPTSLLTVTAKYGGSAGLGIIIGISAANDGNANHFNMTATASGASGTTQEVYPNCNISGIGSDVLPGIGSSVLLGSVVKLASGIPVTGNTTMTGGTSPSVSAADYVGTPGANNNGLALLEADDTIDGVFYDDPGSSLIGTANAGLVSHATLLQDRICYISGPSGQTASAAQTDAIGLSGNINSVYVDPWAYVSDDTDGTLRNCPASCWAASVAAQLPPSVSIAWKADTVKNMLSGIAKLEADRGSTRAANTAAGISTLIKAKNGGFCFEAGVNMSGTAGLTNLTRTRMGIYIAKSAIESWYPFVDAPNVPFFQQDLINSAEAFLATLKRNATVNPAVLPYILDYQILPTSASNTPSTVAAGAFNVASNIKIGSNMSFISLSMAYGETVTVSTS